MTLTSFRSHWASTSSKSVGRQSKAIDWPCSPSPAMGKISWAKQLSWKLPRKQGATMKTSVLSVNVIECPLPLSTVTMAPNYYFHNYKFQLVTVNQGPPGPSGTSDAMGLSRSSPAKCVAKLAQEKITEVVWKKVANTNHLKHPSAWFKKPIANANAQEPPWQCTRAAITDSSFRHCCLRPHTHHN